MTELERYKEALDVALSCFSPYPGTFRPIITEIESILNPPPEMEDVELNSWAIIAPSGFIETTSTNEGLQRDQVGNANGPFYGYQVAKLTGTYQRQKPQKVTRTAEAVGVLMSSGEDGTCIWPHDSKLKGDADWGSVVGRRGTLTFTWTE